MSKHEYQYAPLEAFAEAEKRIQETFKSGATEIYLSKLGLTELPQSIGQLSKLRVLYLHGNRLTTLPESIGQLVQLILLHLENNEITVLPETIGNLHQLKQLYLDNNRLMALPESTSKLTQLYALELDNNELTKVNESIGQLTLLHRLKLSGNRLANLPKSIGQLVQLQHLGLSDNQLLVLPESIGRLTQLQILMLSGNQLKALPKSIRNLSALERLYLHDNSLLGLPAEILGPTQQDVNNLMVRPEKPNKILEYYFRLQSGQRPLNEAKLILVGRGEVGKTSLVNQLVHSSFNLNEQKTEGINITEWKFRLHSHEKILLHIWDFGGQEIMHATHQFFLTQRCLYLLVLNGREGAEDTDAEYWLRLIGSFGADSPVIIVLNKIRVHAFDLNRRGLQQKYSNIRDFIKTDCSDGTGIRTLRSAIEREIDRLEDLRKVFPSSWFGIKNQFARMKENYLGFEMYRKICNHHGETEPQAQEDLAGFLHRLGILLNFKDDPRLQDTHVLNPRWVTNGIYRILNSTKLEKQKGEIRLQDLAEILTEDEYPASMRRFIFDLMKKFDLCFNFPDDDTHYLIPELLQKQEPAETAEFKPEECLNFQYHYAVLPEGLLPRFIVRTHLLSDGLARWRTGVILKFEDCKALIKADVHDKKVFISVSGHVPERRRELLAIIRSDFERIHRDIRSLQPQAMVPLFGYPNTVVPYEKLVALEQKAISVLPEFADGRVIELNVTEMLNGIDLEDARLRDETIDEELLVTRLFYSYSHKDEAIRNELETQLKLLSRMGLITEWHDRKIEAGDDWKTRIDENLERADVILLLVSADFIASDYCYEKEMKRALQRHIAGEARVIPIIIREVNWRRAEFAKLQALPKDGKAVMEWPSKDAAWRNVSEGIERIVDELRKNKFSR
jgi:internalin A